MDVLGLPARRLGNGLLTFGVIGLLLTTVITIAWLAGLLAIRDLDERLEADRAATAAALADAASLLDNSASALGDSASSLGSVGATLDDSARLLNSLAASTADLADALDITILGQQPFAGLVGSFEDIAAELDTVANDADALAGEVGRLEPEFDAVAVDLRRVEASVTAVATRVRAFDGVEDLVGLLRGYGLLSALLSAWLGILAAGCIWAGRRLRQAADPISAETIPTS